LNNILNSYSKDKILFNIFRIGITIDKTIVIYLLIYNFLVAI
jgi:hypothetical protein